MKQKRIVAGLNAEQLTTKQYLNEMLGEVLEDQIIDAFMYNDQKKIQELIRLAQEQLVYCD